jgi:anti-sigma B factor antagonist
MSINVTTRQVGEVAILDINGRIALGQGSESLRTYVQALLDKGSNRILLNLAYVEAIDSSGIGELVSAYTSAKKAGGEIKLFNLSRKLRDLFNGIKLDTVFDIRDNEASAVASFAF